MNKKLLGLALAITFLAMLVTPVMAGKGQNRVSFKFVLVGTFSAAPAESLELGNATHILDLPFAAYGWPGGDEPYTTPYAPLALEIDGVPIDSGLLSYTGNMEKIFSNVNGGSVIMVSETITVEGLGTLELMVKGNVNRGNGVGNGDNFIGFGTGAYEGVKIQGDTPAGPMVIGEFVNPVGETQLMYRLERVGTVMGWP